MLPVREDTYQGQLEFTFYLEDEAGGTTPIQTSELPLEMPGEAVVAATPAHITYGIGFMVRPGNHRLALTVSDVLGSAASTLTWHLTVDTNNDVWVTAR